MGCTEGLAHDSRKRLVIDTRDRERFLFQASRVSFSDKPRPAVVDPRGKGYGYAVMRKSPRSWARAVDRYSRAVFGFRSLCLDF